MLWHERLNLRRFDIQVVVVGHRRERAWNDVYWTPLVVLAFESDCRLMKSVLLKSISSSLLLFDVALEYLIVANVVSLDRFERHLFVYLAFLRDQLLLRCVSRLIQQPELLSLL